MTFPRYLYILLGTLTHAAIMTPPWRDSRIHVLGNHGFLGRIHAFMAMPITKLIDTVAYEGRDIRSVLHSAGPDAVDLGCGIGLSTPPGAKGIDSSIEMLRVGRFLHPSVKFDLGLAERWGTPNMTSVAICSFLLHEQSDRRRDRILRNAYRIARDYVLVMDIDPIYLPSSHMLAGEPYVMDYLHRIDEQIRNMFPMYTRVELIPGHVVLWNITKISQKTKCNIQRIKENFMEFGA